MGSSQGFGGALTLVNYFMRGGPDEHKVLVTGWICERPIPKDYTLYVHFVDRSGNLLAQDDHRLGERSPGGPWPTSQWHCPGYYVDETYVPRDAIQFEELRVGLGLWIPETGERLFPFGPLMVDSFGRTILEIAVKDHAVESEGMLLVDEYRRTWVDCHHEAICREGVRLLRYEGDRIEAEVTFDREGLLVHATHAILDGKQPSMACRLRCYR